MPPPPYPHDELITITAVEAMAELRCGPQGRALTDQWLRTAQNQIHARGGLTLFEQRAQQEERRMQEEEARRRTSFHEAAQAQRQRRDLYVGVALEDMFRDSGSTGPADASEAHAYAGPRQAGESDPAYLARAREIHRRQVAEKKRLADWAEQRRAQAAMNQRTVAATAVQAQLAQKEADKRALEARNKLLCAYKARVLMLVQGGHSEARKMLADARSDRFLAAQNAFVRANDALDQADGSAHRVAQMNEAEGAALLIDVYRARQAVDAAHKEFAILVSLDNL